MRAVAAASAAVLAQKAEAVVAVYDNGGSGWTLALPSEAYYGVLRAGIFFNPLNGAVLSSGCDSDAKVEFMMDRGCAGSLPSIYFIDNLAEARFVGVGGYTVDSHSMNFVSGACFFAASGAGIDSTSPYAFSLVGTGLNYHQSFFAGLMLIDQGLNHDETYFGWAEFRVDDLNSATLLRFGVDDSGAPITIGEGASAIPEPANAVLLFSAGAAGVALLRRRRKQKEMAAVAVAD